LQRMLPPPQPLVADDQLARPAFLMLPLLNRNFISL
jgi:hypothetical protein